MSTIADQDLPTVADLRQRRVASWYRVDAGSTELTDDELGSLLGIPDLAGTSLRITAAAGFHTFDVLGRLVREILPAIRAYAPGLLRTYRAALDFVLGTDADGRRGLTSGADAVTYAVVRRISRESMHGGALMDKAARFLVAAFHDVPALRSRRHLVIVSAELADRPSLRVVYRMQQLDDQDPRLSVVLLTGASPHRLPDEGLHMRLSAARADFLDHLISLSGAVTVRPETARDPGLVPTAVPTGSAAGGDEILRPLADALVNQNYEAVYHHAAVVLAGPAEPRLAANTLRLVALADANTGRTEQALEMLDRALERGHDPDFAAHLWYLKGLLHTKRRYQLDQADACFDRGTELLTPRLNEDSARFELAWLHNGKALVLALRARAAPAARDRTRLLEDAMRLEFRAFDSVPAGRSAEHVYLRYNLLANLTFLLEIMERFPEALGFWNRAFGQFLHAQGRDTFERSYRYREAMLRWRADQPAAAADELAGILRITGEREEWFVAERVYEAAARLAVREAGPRQAAGLYLRAAALAYHNRDWAVFARHLRSMALCAKRAGADRMLAEATELLAALPADIGVTDRNPPEDTGEDLAMLLPAPNPKLPAYLPLLDLEPTPKRNLNVYLAHGADEPLAGARS